ncbi:hypothetical protein Tco_0624826 [Tanacetum coccineum]|uniref:Uncharacterized protein n=1 Tax=Tanacetum coccineum TaxID=301880 RepID=A0ABQ4WF69_9ASTR
MNNSVTIAYKFELHFVTTSLDGLKSGNSWWRVVVVDGGDGGLKGCLDPWSWFFPRIVQEGKDITGIKGLDLEEDSP